MTQAAAPSIHLAPPRAQVEATEHAVDSDGVLVRMAQAGDTAAFGRLVRRHEHRVLAVARRAADVRDPEDVAQDAFVRAWRALGRVDPTRPLAPWLLTIAVRTARTHAARERRQAFRERQWWWWQRPARGVGSPTPDRDVADADARTELWRTVDAALSPDARTALWLRYGEELSTRMIAVVLDSTDPAVRALLARARRTLRARLEASGGEEGPRETRP